MIVFSDMSRCPPSHCSTVRGQSFAVAGARLWHSLPPDILACDTLSRFRRELIDSHIPLLCFSFSFVFFAVFTKVTLKFFM